MDDARALAGLPAVEMVRRFADRSLSPVEVHDAVQTVIERAEPILNAMCDRDPEESRQAAVASERRWLDGQPLGVLDGVPVSVKENVARRGVAMRAGSAGTTPIVPDADAPATARIKEAGGVVVGSTVMPDFGMLSSGVSSLHGITRSPWNPAWTSGGSSAGAGAAAAAGYGPLHVGTDIGGSIRLPGTWLGLATLKPSYGRVPLADPFPGRVAGPMARTVADAALLMSVLSRPDTRDWTALPPADIDWTAGPLAPAGLRVGLHLNAGCGEPSDAVVVAAVEQVAHAFARAGAVVEPIEPFLRPELLADLDQFWKVRSWNDLQRLPADQRRRVHPYIVDWCCGGADLSARRLMECHHHMMEMQARTVAATADYDVVLSPAAPTTAFPAERPMPFTDPGKGMWHIGFTAPYNLSGQPAATVNAGFTPDGRPIGVQMSGRRFDDSTVLRACAWYEHARPSSAIPVWPTVGQTPLDLEMP